MNLKEINIATKQVAKTAAVKTAAVTRKKIIRIAQYVVIVATIGLIIWDIWLVGNNHTTISRIIHKHSMNSLFCLSWIWGVITAHLFLARKKDQIKVPEGVGILTLIITSVVLIFIGYKVPAAEIWGVKSHILFLITSGIIGYYLWPQEWMDIKIRQEAQK